MAKIGTAHVEVKPVLNEEALAEVTRRIEEAVRDAVQRALVLPTPLVPNRMPGTTWTSDRTAGCPCRPENGGSGVCGCILGGPQVTC